jgi:hypothetical protein
MLGFGQRKSDNSASEDWFPPLLACASRIASQAKGTTFLTEHVVPMFAHIIVVFSLTESQHLQKRDEMRANEMAGQEPLSNRSRPFFRVDMHDGFERDATRTLTPRIYKNSAQHSASGAAFHLLTLGPKTGSVLTSFTSF